MAPDRERLRATFTEDAELYDRARPGYPAELFADLESVLGRRVLEIGCGTGQLTLPLARAGHAITAVELGAEMAAIARRKLVEFPDVEVVVSAFEDLPLPQPRVDSVVAATSFHWIDPAIRMTKAADVLKPGGVLAVISTHHIAGGSTEFFATAQQCYDRFDPDTPPNLRLGTSAEIPFDDKEFTDSDRFGPVHFARYEWEKSYSGREYQDLLATYSNHRALPPDARAGLFRCLTRLIGDERITKRHLTQLAWSRSR
ncbi:class I SAM-dependent methyltransferase [Amycolatopsis sp.]|uniref:class I SAM-dependent methyltransferase n=1 Tax=Amycolatopsis sp. TaxID=37632 RepID=UPI002CD744DB|nr:class I SAM-dependent methyltransferase [Amycolatopsis sp.]HVV08788.1 class I SAM-dependent methyltransferase [Amycolatopsis sp.]